MEFVGGRKMTEHITTSIKLAHDSDYLSRCADVFWQYFPAAEAASVRVVLPNLLLAEDFKLALQQSAGGKCFLPRMQTLSGHLQPWLDGLAFQSNLRRRLSLFQALEGRQWFAAKIRWQLAGELIELFDELSLLAQNLPDSADDLLRLYQHSFSCSDNRILSFEAHLVHKLWLTERQGEMSRAQARVRAAEQFSQDNIDPFFIVAEAPLQGFEVNVYRRLVASAGRKLIVCLPERQLARSSLGQVLDLAWPPQALAQDMPPLARRAEILKENFVVGNTVASELAGRVQLCPADSLEQAALMAVDQLFKWLAEGHQQLAILAQDRSLARRVQALLASYDVLVDDESGWRLSTTTAASLVFALLEFLLAPTAVQAMLNLFLQAPFFAHWSATRRQWAIAGLRQLLAGLSQAQSIDELLRRLDDKKIVVEASLTRDEGLLEALQALREVLALCPSGKRSFARWLAVLRNMLSKIGALEALRSTNEGRMFDWLELAEQDLHGHAMELDFAQFRQCLLGEIDAVSVPLQKVSSPIVLTHLTASRWRRFDAVVVLGADGRQLGAVAGSALINHPKLRLELGLSGREEAAQQVEDDLAALILNSSQTLFLWQHQQKGEQQLLNASLARLQHVYHQASGIDLQRLPINIINFVANAEYPPAADETIAYLPQTMLPKRLSATAYADLKLCPYRYYLKHILRLRPPDDLDEEPDNRHCGLLAHKILENFHRSHPIFLAQTELENINLLREESLRQFATLPAQRFFVREFQRQWLTALPSYVAWQREREQEGWQVAELEADWQQELSISANYALELFGKVDRLDQHGNTRHQLIDYKFKKKEALHKMMRADGGLQLAFYGALDGALEKAFFLGVRPENNFPAEVELEDIGMGSEQITEAIIRDFSTLQSKQKMPANGYWRGACTYCDYAGVCRQGKAQ